MNAQTCMVDICCGQSIPPIINFQDICHANATGQQNAISGIFICSRHSFSTQRSAGHSVLYDKYRKAFLKGQKAASRVGDLFNGGVLSESSPDGKPPSAVHFMERPQTSSAFAYVFDEAIISGSLCDGHAKSLEGITSFQKMKFHFQKALHSGHEDLISTQILHFSIPTLRNDQSLFTQGGTSDFDSLSILSGMCLLSDKILRGSIRRDGSLDIQRLHYTRPTIYEMEYIVRASSAIADITATLVHRAHSRAKSLTDVDGKTIDITLDVPNWHYYQAIHEILVQGLCTANEALRWLEAIELRYDQMASVFEKAVGYELGRRGVIASNSCNIHVTPKTGLVSNSIRRALLEGKVPSLPGILRSLNHGEDSTWRDFYLLIPEKERPQDFQALGHLFYMFIVTKAALSPSVSTRPLIISIDDSAERKIYSRAQKILKKIRQNPANSKFPTLIEIYMFRRVFIDGNKFGSNLYLGDPSPDVPFLSISDSDNHSSEYSLTRVEAVGIIEYLYGSNCATNIQTWFKEVGLG